MNEVLSLNEFTGLRDDELMEVDGGWVAVAVVATIAVVGFAVGVYNGYQEAKRSDK